MNQPTTLIVDDNQDIAYILGEFFQFLGWRFEFSYSGEDAVQRSHERPYDLVLMDIRLPGMDGIEAMAAIRHARPGARVLLMTGFDDIHLTDTAMAKGALEVMRKPLDMEHLAQIVHATPLNAP